MKRLDLRSDTVTRPTPEMRLAMANAEVGDDVYGEDPTVRRLEERTAELLGQPAALFVPSGSQGNQIAIGLFCRPGDEVIAETGSHCIQFEGGAMSALWGAQPRALDGVRGTLTPAQVTWAVRPDNEHSPRSRLLALENTHNRGGGAVWPRALFLEVVQAAREHRLAVHLDGARLFNAHIASGVPLKDLGRGVDTVTVCFSKGLGAPAGSVLCASSELIREARRLRKRLGGGMRQVGILAAAALHALDHHLPRLAEDHANARALAAGLAALPGVTLAQDQVETNMVFVDTGLPAARVVPRLAAQGLLCNAEGSKPNVLRLVTHLDFSAADVPEAIERFRRALS